MVFLGYEQTSRVKRKCFGKIATKKKKVVTELQIRLVLRVEVLRFREQT
jgi:hypothetical protein